MLDSTGINTGFKTKKAIDLCVVIKWVKTTWESQAVSSKDSRCALIP